MSGRRWKAGQPFSGSDKPQRPPSEPLSFHEPVPSTLLPRLWFYMRELFHLAKHILNVLVFGIGYDMVPLYGEGALRQQKHERKQRGDEQKAQRQDDNVLLGYIRSTHELWWHPGSPTVTLRGDVVAGELDSFAHAIAAYAHLSLNSSTAAEQSRIVRYTGQSATTIDPSSYEPYAFPTFEYAPHGSLQAFLLSTQSYPSLTHPAIPPSTAKTALPLHWLLNLASSISFLHSHGIAHRALAVDLLWLRADFSVALFDLTCAVFISHDDEWAEDVPFEGDLPSWGSFPFPINEVHTRYYSGATPEDAMAFGRAMDVFNFGTVAWRVLSRNVKGRPQWVMPKRKEAERGWSILELRRKLREAIGTGISKSQYEPPGMEVVRRCWALEYCDGGEVLEALKRVVLETGLKVQGSDEIEGVGLAAEEFKRDYWPEGYLGEKMARQWG
jgi:hypothetical protein